MNVPALIVVVLDIVQPVYVPYVLQLLQVTDSTLICSQVAHFETLSALVGTHM